VPVPKSADVWHLLHVAGTAGMSMPVWHSAHTLPAWPTFSDPGEPSWHVAQSAKGTAFAPLWW
jgi:hypothetical protein